MENAIGTTCHHRDSADLAFRRGATYVHNGCEDVFLSTAWPVGICKTRMPASRNIALNSADQCGVVASLLLYGRTLPLGLCVRACVHVCVRVYTCMCACTCVRASAHTPGHRNRVAQLQIM